MKAGSLNNAKEAYIDFKNRPPFIYIKPASGNLDWFPNLCKMEFSHLFTGGGGVSVCHSGRVVGSFLGINAYNPL